MFTPIPGPHQHFNAYYQDNALLIQFILTEFIQTHYLVEQIRPLTKDFLSIQQIEESLAALFHSLNQLLGCLADKERSSISRWRKGPLTKMKAYCEYLAFHHQTVHRSHIHLHQTVYQTWLVAIHNLELISLFRLYRGSLKKLSFLTYIQRSLNKLHTRLKLITKQIPRAVNHYWNNENVFFFLIKKKEELLKIYGQEKLDKAFKSFAKQALLTPFLIQKYKDRGFERFPLTSYLEGSENVPTNSSKSKGF